MALSDYKITEAQINQYGVISAPDILTGTADENKAVFDKLIRQIVANAVNNLIDALSNSGAASELPINPIEGLDAETVQQAITEINNNLADYIAKIKGTGGAAQVGVSAISGMSVSNTQQALAELKRLIDNLVIGTLPPGSVTANMIEDGAIVQLGALLAVAAAAAYDPEGSYAVGDYCTNGGKLHKCGTAIPDGEAWTAEHWTATSVAAELAEVHSLLAPLGGATTAQGALAALGAGVRPNLLDNAIFIGGGSQQGGGQLPVNQRGKTNYTASGYCIDRWKIVSVSASVTLTDDGITLTHNGVDQWILFEQLDPSRLADLKGKYLFVSVLTSTGLVTLDVPSAFTSETSVVDPSGVCIWVNVGGGVYLGTTGTDVTLIAAKLELGSTQTLAYQDGDGAWQLLPQPESDYATQLAKCQRYLYALESITMCPGGVEDDNLIFGIRFPVEMRIAPVFIGAEGGNNLQLYVEGSSGFYENQNFTLQWSSRTGATIKCQSPISLPPNSACNGQIDGELMFSAEL